MGTKLQLQTQSLKNVSDLYKILADKYKVKPELIKMITNHPYDYVASTVRNRKDNTILLHNLGTFEISLFGVNKDIRMYLSFYRAGAMSRENAVKEISELWKLRVKAQSIKNKKKIKNK
jgi:uncharacterized protein YbgA (DUF1722 family)